MNNLVSRAITGALFVTLLVWCILSGPKYAAVLFLPFTIVGLFELNRILKSNKQNTTLSIFLGVLSYVSVVSFKLNPENVYYAKLLLAAIFIAFIVWYSPYGSQHEPIDWILWIYQNLRWDL